MWAEVCWESQKKICKYINILSLKLKFELKKIEKMDDFSFEDAGDQLDDDIAEAIRLSLAEATAPSPHSAKKALNQGMFSNKVNFY